MNRDEKSAMIQELSASVATAPHAFLIDYTGITVPAVTDLRRQIRGSKAEYLVVKNTLALRAIKGKPLEALAEHFTGMTAVAYSQTDVVALAKVIHTFGKTNPHVKVRRPCWTGRRSPPPRSRRSPRCRPQRARRQAARPDAVAGPAPRHRALGPSPQRRGHDRGGRPQKEQTA